LGVPPQSDFTWKIFVEFLHQVSDKILSCLSFLELVRQAHKLTSQNLEKENTPIVLKRPGDTLKKKKRKNLSLSEIEASFFTCDL
jgi:hypothetical protein